MPQCAATVTKTQPGRRRRQRGNAMVETALMILPFFAMLLALIDFSYAFFMRTTLQNAVRTGIRYAVTWQTMSGKCYKASVKESVRLASLGFIKTTNVDTYVKVRYFDPISLGEVASNAPGNIVEVTVENYQWNWMGPIWRTAAPYTVLVRSSDRMEGYPQGGLPGGWCP